MSYSNFNTFKLFQNVGINSSGDYMVSMKPNDNNVSFHSSNSIDYNNVDIMSIKNIINKKQNEDLNLSSLTGTTINPVITINNNNQDCRIMTNLNVAGNLNINGPAYVGVASTNNAVRIIGSGYGNGAVGISWYENESTAQGEEGTRKAYIYAGTDSGNNGTDGNLYLHGSKNTILSAGTGYVKINDDLEVVNKLSIGTPYSHSSWSGGLKYPLYVGDKAYEYTGAGSIDADPEATSTFPRYFEIGNLPTVTWGDNYAYNLSARFIGKIWTTNAIYYSSDSRIKTNIVDVPDNLALEQLRSIPCRYYEYIDKLKKGSDKTIGFIAQEVKSIMPMTVSQEEDFIPNVYKVINCTWNSVNDKFIMSSTDLPNVSGIVYKFYVSNNTNASDEKEITLTGNSDNTFTCDTQYTNVFCYGSIVDDFHIVDKNKLFTLNFSATQEIDRIQQTHITEIASLKTENQQQQNEINTLKTENQQQQTKINELTSIIDKLKTANSFEEFKNSL